MLPLLEALMLTLRSPSFPHGGAIPRKHTCQDADASPELIFGGVPAGTRSLALIVDDPDAPDPVRPLRTWVHWVLYDLPPDCGGLPESVVPIRLPPGTRAGRNDWRRTTWGGPCPPRGRHRYFFKLYALDATLGDLGEPDAGTLARAMEGHVLARAELMGTYEKG